MSLNVYLKKEDVPENIRVVEQNDKYFNLNTPLMDDNTTKEFLKLDGSVYNSPDTFIPREQKLGAMYRENICTGVKTVLNVHSHPEDCFSLLECGENILEKMYLLTRGNVLWPGRLCIVIENEECDIMMQGKHYMKYKKFLDALFYELQEVYV